MSDLDDTQLATKVFVPACVGFVVLGLFCWCAMNASNVLDQAPQPILEAEIVAVEQPSEPDAQVESETTPSLVLP